MPFLAFFLSPIGRYVGGGLVILAILGGIYLKGRSDARASYKATIEREITDAITKGDAARERALRDFDASSELPGDDGFRRP